MKKVLALTVLTALSLAAQGIQWPAGFDQLAEKAEEVVDITVDSALLGLAGAFLSGQDEEEAKVKGLVEGLKGIYVRSYEFAAEGAYSMKDVDDLRAQLDKQGWTRVVNVQSGKATGDNVAVYLKKNGDAVTGLTVLAAEPKELTVVHIDGPVNLRDLAKLSGSFGIPKVEVGPDEENK